MNWFWSNKRERCWMERKEEKKNEIQMSDLGSGGRLGFVSQNTFVDQARYQTMGTQHESEPVRDWRDWVRGPGAERGPGGVSL